MGLVVRQESVFLRIWVAATRGVGCLATVAGVGALVVALVDAVFPAANTMQGHVALWAGVLGIVGGLSLVFSAYLLQCFLNIENNTRVVAELMLRKNQRPTPHPRQAGDREEVLLRWDL